MKRLTKIEKVKRWLASGKSLTQMQAISHFNYYRLADAIHKLRKAGLWIIDISKEEHSKYFLLKQGQINNLMVKGPRIHIESADYINGFKEMRILITAYNGAHSVSFGVTSEAFIDQKIMKQAITENLKKIK